MESENNDERKNWKKNAVQIYKESISVEDLSKITVANKLNALPLVETLLILLRLFANKDYAKF